MRSDDHRSPLKAALLCGAAAALLPLAAGCSGGSAEAGGSGGKQAQPATAEQLAQQTGCKLSSLRKVADLSQGSCQTDKGRFTVVSFTTDQGQHAWLEEAKPWGGTYLVGPRWVIVSTEQTLKSLQEELGGQIEYGAHHGGGGGGGHQGGGTNHQGG
ncbi:hypothetical protein Arub01_14450 [Actinomadura rubrobrunea]|uniref:Lipoprotein n=1 Tax=Actinomadura rubrobrunea TaxID=115335 RepID=A0A9W6PUG0_9ACTN|nr:hypothetical protein [Actinomadura rubrobrunea]GLW63201.1 hypothetical protein Arub01_14450 [Actinomadura rubrobrunea]